MGLVVIIVIQFLMLAVGGFVAALVIVRYRKQASVANERSDALKQLLAQYKEKEPKKPSAKKSEAAE